MNRTPVEKISLTIPKKNQSPLLIIEKLILLREKKFFSFNFEVFKIFVFNYAQCSNLYITTIH